VTRCAVRVGDYLGVGYVLGRDRRHAELVAVLDAMLQDGARQVALLRDVVDPLAQAQAEARAARSREVASSRVEFFTMVREAA
jgi:alpha-D-ribose 1-methylphosphonate 5-triphosphate synthase subunit PhnG